MKHKSKEKYYRYEGGDCYSYTSVCSCGYLALGWTAKECEEERLKHELIENYNLDMKDIENELYGIMDAINAKILNFES